VTVRTTRLPAVGLATLALAATAGAAVARPDSLEARLALRECVAAQRAAAVTACAHALDLGLGPERAATAQRLLGRAFATLERWEEALPAYREALRLTPDDPDAALAVGTALLYGLSRPVEAEPYLRQALAGRPDDAVFHVHLGTALNGAGRYAEALDEFKAALGLDVTVLDGRPASQATYLASLRQALWP
jgi:tetratricopeptide (TPR) repeat protein